MAPRILVVDDERNMRELFALHLRNAGYEVHTAEDGLAAGYQVLCQRPDLIVTDIVMPHLDGFAFVAALRNDTALADIPVIFVTGALDQELRAKELGGLFLRKPLRADKLLSAVAANVYRTAKKIQEKIDAPPMTAAK